MAKYFEVVDLEQEIKRLLIGEFGSVANAKKDMTIFSHHLPEKLQEEIVELAKQRFPYITKNQDAYKECFQELNQNIKTVLSKLYA